VRWEYEIGRCNGQDRSLLHNDTDVRVFSSPDQRRGEVAVLLDGESIADLGLVVAEQDGAGREAVDQDGVERWRGGHGVDVYQIPMFSSSRGAHV
jgi:hypothetical protein